MTSRKTCEALVIGGGPAGLTAAILLARSGVDTICLAPPAAGTTSDARTAALMIGAVRLMDRLGIWHDLEARAAPLRRLGIVDRTGRQISAPDALFDADELGDEPFGWNIPLHALNPALLACAAEEKNLGLLKEPAAEILPGARAAMAITSSGLEIGVKLMVGADGRTSPSREAAGIRVDGHETGQWALIAAFSHSRAHGHTSLEFHHRAGPMTLVPLPGKRSSLVWVESRKAAHELAALDDREFARRLEARMGPELGAVSKLTARALIPVHSLVARSFARNRTVLVGEAAHVLPPIGAQGLNLGLRDAALVAELVVRQKARGRDIGADEMLRAYDRRRKGDVLSRAAATGLLNRTLMSELLAAQGLRSAGITALNLFAPLRRAVMRQGRGAGLPQIMQP